MSTPSPFISAAHRWARARRWLLLGNRGPFFARYAPDDLPTVDPAEHGEVAVRIWARWRVAEQLEEGFRDLTSLRIEQGGTSLGLAGALGRLAVERDRVASASLARALAKLVRGPGMALGSTFARAADLAAEKGVPRLVEPNELQAARDLLAITEEPVRDVLVWATQRAGRPRRSAITLADVLAVLRNESLDELFRSALDPWPSLFDWHQRLGSPITALTEVATADDAWLGSWALRGRRSRLVGVSAWPGALRARFALQGLGRLEALSAGGLDALLPRDPIAVQLLEAVYPMLLTEPSYLGRVFSGELPNADAGRLVTLAELLLQRAQAAALLILGAFDESRELAAVVETAGALSRALYASVPADLAILLVAPWADGLSGWPSVTMTASALCENWCEEFDEDFWRNPRFGEPLRGIASRSGRETLLELGGSVHASGRQAYSRWVEASLGR